MGNLFLGFPVSKAKIADMITGTAAPSAHHTQHENGGSDEIDATGLTGAGGGGIGIADFFSIHHTFESITGYNNNNTGSGSFSATFAGLEFITGTTTNSHARTNKGTPSISKELNFSKDITLNCNAGFLSYTNVTADFIIRLGGNASARGIGFKVVDGVLYGSVGNGSIETTVVLETLGTGSFFKYRTLRAVYTAGVKCEFYVDLSLLGTITTGLPSSWDPVTGTHFFADVHNKTSTATKYLYVANFDARIKN